MMLNIMLSFFVYKDIGCRIKHVNWDGYKTPVYKIMDFFAYYINIPSSRPSAI